MANESQLSLRVLYTISTSPQYILAKSPEKIPLLAAGASPETNSTPVYGCVPLKTCATAICRSSPEITPGPSRDYSVYVLDPLEDLLSKGRSQSGSNAGGVAVGMGLLSQVLSPYSTDSSIVIGTIVESGNGGRALEVVLSLRQVTPSASTVPQLHLQAEAQPPFLYNHGPIPGPSNSTQKGCSSMSPFASHPLPSFQERLYHHHLYGSQSYNQTQNRNGKRNPAHDTRAFHFPTPYIGPPKRRPGRPRKEPIPSSDSFEANPIHRIADPLETNPSTSDLHTDTIDLLPTPPSSQPSQPSQEPPAPPPAPPFDIAQNAVILAALSAVRSGSANTSAVPLSHDTPNESLVTFLKAYLTALEGSKPTRETNTLPAPESTASTPQCEELTKGKISERKEVIEIADKENVKPSRHQQVQGEEGKQSISSASSASSIAPLGVSHFNSRADLGPPGSDFTAPIALSPDESQPPGITSRKRRLSESIRLDDVASRPRTKSSLSRSASDSIGPESRVNSGWGGLRIRSDANSSSGQTPEVASTSPAMVTETRAPTQQVSYFRATCTTATSVRKGPFIIPDWARNVPPPPPPSRSEGENDEEQASSLKAAKKRTKSKGLGRLGGQQTVRRTSGSHASSSGLAPSPDLEAQPPTPQKEKKPATPKTSPMRSPAASRMPVFAQSSPVVKTSYASLFQAFQTSPCRPSRVSERSPRRYEPPSTPCRANSYTPSKRSIKSLSRHSSLFTPSPHKSSSGARTSRQSLFDLISGPPPSPTPSKRKLQSSTANRNVSSPMEHDNAQPQLTFKEILEKDCKIQEDDDTPMSALPIASSESDQEPASIQRSSSSDFTATTPFKIHDWSSLDLPPSSPPPPSSPTLHVTYDSDLPCSDIPSSDFDFGDTPSSITDADKDSTAPTPQEPAEEPPLAIFDGMSFVGMDQLFSDWDFSDFNVNMASDNPQDGTAADGALGALRNGMGQEDFSEAWNLLNSVLLIPESDLPGNAASLTTEGRSDYLPLSQSSDAGLDCKSDVKFDNIDYASLVASNFEDLLKGCLV